MSVTRGDSLVAQNWFCHCLHNSIVCCAMVLLAMVGVYLALSCFAKLMVTHYLLHHLRHTFCACCRSVESEGKYQVCMRPSIKKPCIAATKPHAINRGTNSCTECYSVVLSLGGGGLVFCDPCNAAVVAA